MNYNETKVVSIDNNSDSNSSEVNIEKIGKRRRKIRKKIKKLQVKITNLEYELIELERKTNDINQKDIINQINLNDQQMSIVKKVQDIDSSKNMLVLACPGSGKTHTLISRFVNLVTTQEIEPEKILLITFTKKAGQEMENRINDIIPNKIPYYVGSLHGLGYRILQKYDKINYTVLDDKDSRLLIREVVENTLNAIDYEDEDISLVKSKVIMVIEQASTSHPFNITDVVKKLNLSTYDKIFRTIIKNYQEVKKKQNLVDFNDLMTKFAKFLDTKKSIEFINEIEYVFFDEYQDVNPIQNYILSKFINSKIMVVGDDAQSIYKFRGSDVKYIREFKSNFYSDEIYYLETNYRSTQQIVNICENIVDKNHSQYKKVVKSLEDKSGSKPQILQFNDSTDSEQYKWICHDIKKRNQAGVPFSDMVILARKNSLLDKIEFYMVSSKIPILKHLGISLLDKSHIKDFMAFLTILVNEKSSIHWKRVLALHPTIGVVKANEIIEYKDNIREGVKILVKKNDFYRRSLECFVNLLDEIDKTILIMEKVKLIISYLHDVWKKNKQNQTKGMKNWNIEEKIEDTKILLGYLSNQSTLEDFVNNLYLNHEVDSKYEESVFLTTVHGAKGLEWKYVYIIDMDSKNFPAIMPKFYIDELEEMEEERRLFYVAASRAKDELLITYHVDYHPERLIVPSPLIRELKDSLYIAHGVEDSFYNETIAKTGIVSKDVSTYFKFKGFYGIRSIIDTLEKKFRLEGVNKSLEIPMNLNSKGYKTIMGNFFDYIISKMLLVNYPNKVVKFDLNLINRYPNFNKKIYHNYVDPLVDWRNTLEEIFYIASYKYENKELVEMWKEFLLSEKVYVFLIALEKGLLNYFSKKDKKISKIYTHYNLNSYHNDNYIKGELDLLVDDHLFEIKSSAFEVCTLSNLSQTLMYGHLLQNKVVEENNNSEILKHIKIRKISIYNPLMGIMNTFDTSNFDFNELADRFYPEGE